jgi:hypothetical protein
MAGVKIPDDMLAPGDLVEIEYRIKGGSDILTMMAVNEVEKSLDREEKWDLTRYRFEDRLDPQTNEPKRYVVFTVRYREVSKWDSEKVYETQMAGGLVAVALAISLLAGALAAYAYVEYVGYQLMRKVIEDPTFTPDQKTQILTEGNKQGIGSGLAAAGGSLVTAAVIIGVLWAVSLSARSGVD